MKSILVIGGGLVGAASALRLQHEGAAVTLIDPGDMRRAASYGNAGHLGAEQVSPWSAWEHVRAAPGLLFGAGGPLDFRWRDAGLWGPWALRYLGACGAASVARGREALSTILGHALPAWQRLAALAGDESLVKPHGHALVWMSPARADKELTAALRNPSGGVRVREMSSADLARYQGVLRAPPAAGLFHDGTGQVRDPQGARDAILAAFDAKGGERVRAGAMRVQARKSGVQIQLSDGDARDADALLVAAGAWSRGLMRQLGTYAPLIGERGYSVQSRDHVWPEDLPTTVFEETSVAMSRFDSGLRATSFIEFASPNAPADARKWRRLERHVRDLGVRFSETPDRWVGPRPTLPDYLPAIGRLERAPNVLYAFGHAHLGLTMSAITSELIAALAAERDAPVPLEPLRIERFA